MRKYVVGKHELLPTFKILLPFIILFSIFSILIFRCSRLKITIDIQNVFFLTLYWSLHDCTSNLTMQYTQWTELMDWAKRDKTYNKNDFHLKTLSWSEMIHKTSLNKFIYYQEINSFLTFPPPSWRIFKSEFIIYGDTIIVYEIILSLGNLLCGKHISTFIPNYSYLFIC